MNNDTSEQAFIKWTKRHIHWSARDAWLEAVRRCEARMEEMRVRIARLEGELEMFRKHHKEAQK